MPANLSWLNRFFASCRLVFANGGRAAKVGAVALAAALVASLAGAFGTGALQVAPRTVFWLLAVMPVWLGWELWFAWWMHRGWSWQRTLLCGMPVMLALVPLLVLVLLPLFGMEPAPVSRLVLRAAVIALVLMPVIWLFALRGEPGARPVSDPVANFRGTAIALGQIAALVAEDHYVRIHLAAGGSHLIHRRFRDALADLGATPGQRVHRGAWIAAAHRGPARRQGERWFIPVTPGLALPVSRSRTADLRRLGWIGRRQSPGEGAPAQGEYG